MPAAGAGALAVKVMVTWFPAGVVSGSPKVSSLPQAVKLSASAARGNAPKRCFIVSIASFVLLVNPRSLPSPVL